MYSGDLSGDILLRLARPVICRASVGTVFVDSRLKQRRTVCGIVSTSCWPLECRPIARNDRS